MKPVGKMRPLPPIVGILIGEVIYNLRAALDYLVYELAWLDTGQIQEGTQFPIENCSEVFEGRSSGYYIERQPGKKPRKRRCARHLAGISKTHRDRIEQLQPYKRCNWTKILQSLSNPDKHRELTRPERLLHAQHRVIDPPRQTESGTLVNMEFRYALFVALDGIPLEQVLRELQEEVGKVLALFDPEF